MTCLRIDRLLPMVVSTSAETMKMDARIEIPFQQMVVALTP